MSKLPGLFRYGTGPIRRLPASLLLFFVLALAAFSPQTGAENPPSPAALKQLQQAIRSLESKRKQALSQLNESQRQLAELEERIRADQHKLQKTSRQLRQLQAEITHKQQALQTVEQRQQQLLQQLARQWRTAYSSQQLSRLRKVLQSRDANAFFRWKAQQRYLDRKQLQWLQALQRSQQEKQALLQQLEQQSEQLQQTLAQQQRQMQQLQQSREQWQHSQARHQQQLQGTERELAQARQRQQRLRQLLQELDASLKALDTQLPKAFAQQRGQLPWPVEGQVLHAFGTPRGGGLQWRGVEIQARPGARVRALAHGRVVYADWLRGYGLLLILDHGDGYLSLYGQNAALLHEVGEWVQAGEPLARLDEQGRLYLELRKQAQPVNPLRWLKKRG